MATCSSLSWTSLGKRRAAQWRRQSAIARLASPTMRVVVLTTSYPRSPEDVVGRFVADAVERLRARGVEVEVVSPLSFRHFGIAYGHGVVGNLRRRPWLMPLVPPMLLSFAWAARRVAREADLVHAHWLPVGVVAAAAGRPFVVQLWGTDVELARRAPWLARRILRRARLVICASQELAGAARELGALTVRVIPSGVDVPEAVGEPDDPPHVLYAGRLSEEKGVLELVEATRGMPLVVAGDGPLRDRVPGALGFVSHNELLDLYERAAVVVCPSRREGFGVVCAEAMASGRPVVAAAVGGLRDLVLDGETGLLVPPRNVPALRAALERLLGDPELRRRLGTAARKRAREAFSWDRTVSLTLRAYEDALPTARLPLRP
jgi:glycosyltransferase involved in cell wall biosynthesis